MNMQTKACCCFIMLTRDGLEYVRWHQGVIILIQKVKFHYNILSEVMHLYLNKNKREPDIFNTLL